MAGSAVLGTNLVDSLVPGVIDGIRAALHPDLGVRQFRVFIVTRAYVGDIGGEQFTDAEIEVLPQPLVEPYKTRFKLEPCGIDEAGVVHLREVSLTYTEAELVGPPVDGSDLFVKLTDAHGQGIPTTYWRPEQRPFPDRVKDMGWKLKLTPASVPEGL